MCAENNFTIFCPGRSADEGITVVTGHAHFEEGFAPGDPRQSDNNPHPGTDATHRKTIRWKVQCETIDPAKMPDAVVFATPQDFRLALNFAREQPTIMLSQTCL